MNKFLLISIISMSVLFSDCGKPASDDRTVEHYDLSDYRPGKLADIFSDVGLVPLEYTGKDYPREADNLLVTDSMIIVTDNRKTIHVFSPDGKYISSSSEKQGEGPEEFVMAMGTAWNPHNNMFEIVTLSKLMYYDRYFNYVKEITLPTHFGDGEKEPFF